MYVVLQAGFQYNDEIEELVTEKGTGTPIKALRTKKEAEEEVKRLTIQKLRELIDSKGGWTGLDSYCYNPNDLFNIDSLAQDLGVSLDEENVFDMIKGLPNDKLEILYNNLSRVHFYSYAKV